MTRESLEGGLTYDFEMNKYFLPQWANTTPGYWDPSRMQNLCTCSLVIMYFLTVMGVDVEDPVVMTDLYNQRDAAKFIVRVQTIAPHQQRHKDDNLLAWFR